MQVMDLFFKFRYCDDDKLKEELVENILKELHVNITVEEDITRVLMAELATMKPSDDQYATKVTVLGKLVRHHMQEEEKEMFEKVKNSKTDLEFKIA